MPIRFLFSETNRFRRHRFTIYYYFHNRYIIDSQFDRNKKRIPRQVRFENFLISYRFDIRSVRHTTTIV